MLYGIGYRANGAWRNWASDGSSHKSRQANPTETTSEAVVEDLFMNEHHLDITESHKKTTNDSLLHNSSTVTQDLYALVLQARNPCVRDRHLSLLSSKITHPFVAGRSEQR